VSIEDILSEVKTVTGALLQEAAEEARQETIRILTGSFNIKDNLNGTGP
jgi:hypothetical protein